MASYGYDERPTSAVINTSGAFHLNPQRTAVLHADPSFQTGGYKVAYMNPIIAQPTSGQIMMDSKSCHAQYPMVVDLSQAYKSSVGGGQCACSGGNVTTTQPKKTPARVNRCCPGCAPCCCGECDTYEDSPRQDCMCCGAGCCPPHQSDAAGSPPTQHAAAPPQDCCSCHGCQTMCCGKPCCVCQPCQTNCCGPNEKCCGPNGGCCGPNGECCGPNDGCCGPNGGCCGPNGCCGNCCQPVEVKPVTTQPAPAVNQPVAVTVAPTNGPYTYRTSYNMAGFVPYNGQAVTMVPVENKFAWGGAAVQPYTNVARQVFTQ